MTVNFTRWRNYLSGSRIAAGAAVCYHARRMRIRVRLFGPLAERAGRDSLEVTVSEPTVRAAVAAVPGLEIDRTVRFAVNTDYAEPETRLKEGDTVSLIPPVGGG